MEPKGRFFFYLGHLLAPVWARLFISFIAYRKVYLGGPYIGNESIFHLRYPDGQIDLSIRKGKNIRKGKGI